jgi:SRSO17 transposase
MNRKNWWEWVFVGTQAVLHVIRPTRGKAVVQALFGEIRPAVWVSAPRACPSLTESQNRASSDSSQPRKKLEIPAPQQEATMDLLASEASRLRFETYVEELASVIGHADRVVPLHDYCTGLLLPGERKSVEPMAALTAPARTAPQHQSLLHFVANAPWSDQAMLTKVRQTALPRIEALGAIEASIVDDTGFPKKGRHSVGVARQYCGQLGKQDNCQAVVSLSVANHHASLPIAHRLYLPETWANDMPRRKKAKVPEDIVFKTKLQIALDQLQTAHAAGIPLGTVLADAGYGNSSQFRDGVSALALLYVVGVQSNMLLWKADAVLPLPGPEGQEPSRPQLRAQQVPAKELALNQPAEAWQMITWREGEALTSRFARLRVRPVTRAEQPAEEWLLVEWPEEEAEPTKYWLSTLPADISFEALVDRAKLRWRIERDYQELKQEVGLGHYEGRGWRGLHHHITLCIAAYGFLIAERAIFPPSGPRNQGRPAAAIVPAGYRPGGAAIAYRAACSELHCHTPTADYCRSGRASPAVPLLRHGTDDGRTAELVTQ